MNQNRKYLGMTGSQIGILIALAGALLVILCLAGWLIFGNGFSFSGAQQVVPTPVSTSTSIVIPTLTPTVLPTPIPYEQLIPTGWVQHRTSLVEIWLPTVFKNVKTLPEGFVITAVPELIMSQPVSKTSQYAKWVVVAYEPITTDSLDSFLDLKIQSLPASVRVAERGNVLLNGSPAVKVLIETRVDTLDVNELIYIIQDGSTIWYVSFIAQINDYYAELEMFETGKETFRLVK